MSQCRVPADTAKSTLRGRRPSQEASCWASCCQRSGMDMRSLREIVGCMRLTLPLQVCTSEAGGTCLAVGRMAVRVTVTGSGVYPLTGTPV
eukprot:366519-Chlamydomonas_euryale.AAC.5